MEIIRSVYSLCSNSMVDGGDIMRVDTPYVGGPDWKTVKEERNMVNKDQYRDTIKNFKNNLDDLSKNLDHFLEKTINIGKEFGGPSIYFHKKALLEQKNNFLGENHLNMIYAVMPSWGMHRMGNTGAKMVDYNIFKEEILKNKVEIIELKN